MKNFDDFRQSLSVDFILQDMAERGDKVPVEEVVALMPAWFLEILNQYHDWLYSHECVDQEVQCQSAPKL